MTALFRVFVAALLILPTTGIAKAQTSSSATIRMVVGVPAGGVLDPYARVIADHMKNALGKVIVIENRPGANGNISAQAVLDLPADGQAIWIGTQSMTEINPSAFANMGWSMKNFVPVIKGVGAPLVLVVHPSVPAKTLSELVDYVKKNPGKLSYASFSPGTPSHFLGFQLSEKFGLDLTHVPYKGSGQQVSDLVAGHVLMGFTQLGSAFPMLSSGRLNAIAVTSAERSRHLPNVPTFAEAGHPDFTSLIWFGMFLRKGTPEALVNAYVDAAKAAHADPAVVKQLEKMGFDVIAQTGPRVLTDIETQAERWARLVNATGFKAD